MKPIKFILQLSISVVLVALLTSITIAQRLPLPANPDGLGLRATPLEYVPPVTGSDSLDGDGFGAAIAVTDTVLLVGAPFHDHGGHTDAGAVYVFRLDANGAWVQTQKITAPDPINGAWFGVSIAATKTGDDTVFAIGASDFSDFGEAGTGDDLLAMGKVYLYTPTGVSATWGIDDTLVSPNARTTGRFGYALDYWADGAGLNLIVGAPGEETNESTYGGVVYFYDFVATDPLRIYPPLNQNGMYFGASVSNISSGLYSEILIGAPNYDMAGPINEAGAAFVMGYVAGPDDYQLFNTLFSASPQTNGLFGYSVSGYDNGGVYIAAVGAPQEQDSSFNLAGRAYVFEGDAANGFISPAQPLSASNVAASKRFGHSLYLSFVEGTARLIIGAPTEFLGEAGQAYLFDNTGGAWVEAEMMSGQFFDHQDLFGRAVALYDYQGRTHAVIGAPSGKLTSDVFDTTGIIEFYKRPTPEVRPSLIEHTPLTEGSSSSALFTVRLATQPKHPVTVTATSDSQCALGDFDERSTYTFNFNNLTWSTEQGAIAVAIDDTDIEGTHTCQITFTSTSTDTDYEGIFIEDIIIVINDDDVLTSTELVRNGGMEDPVVAKPFKPINWTFRKLSSKDKRICPGSGSPKVHSGNCSVQMNGTADAPRSVLRSTRTKTDLTDNLGLPLAVGDTLRVQFKYKLHRKTDALVRLVAFRNFGGDRTVLARVELPHPLDEDYTQWLTFDQTFTLTTTDFKQLRLILRDLSKGGNWWIDDVSLLYTPDEGGGVSRFRAP